MDEEVALLRAICEHPDEDTPRLVFADWLQERGDRVSVAWAEAIRAQVARAAGATDVPEPQFFQSPPWWPRRSEGVDFISTRLGVPAQLDAHQWERGFPACLDGKFIRVSAAWPRLLNRVPFHRLGVVMEVGANDAVAEFLRWPKIDRLTDLDLQSWYGGGFQHEYFYERTLQALAACPALSGLVSLELDGVIPTDAGVDALLASRHLRGLKALQFRRAEGALNLAGATLTRLTARFGPDVIVSHP